MPSWARLRAKKGSSAYAASAGSYHFYPFPLPSGRRGLHEKIACYFFAEHTQDGLTMEAEHINQIGNTLEDLTERTRELRRYL